MRILQVRFENLNSLWGEWKIDFRHPAYTSDGIFAITGPTGAGKTTILDAICLALYGRTPRLKDVTQGTNEIMSRQAGECFAEVLFEVSGGNGRGTYCAHWEQHRARRRPDGALQPPRHEIADAETGKILETKQKDVDQKIEEVTGLTFDRFVRSMLLAQGGFATFLQSGANERSPILEQITGTEIYSRISMRTHEIRNAERTKLNALENELSGIKVMTEEEQKQIESELAEQLREESDLERKMKQFSLELEWLDGMENLRKDLEILEDRHRELSGRQDGFESERQRLERARRALEFGSAHAALLALRKEQETEKRALLECQAGVPELEADVRRSEEALQLAQNAYSERQTEQKNSLDLLRRVRELDFRYGEKEPLIADARNAVQQLESAMEELQKKYGEGLASSEKVQLGLRDVHKFLQNNAVDERLVEQLAGIRTRFESLQAILEKRRLLLEECAEAETRKQQAWTLWNGQNALYEAAKARYAVGEALLRRLKNERSEALEAQELSEWRERLDRLLERKEREKQIEELASRQAETKDAMENLNLQTGRIVSAQQNGRTKSAEQQALIQRLEKDVRDLETRMDLIRRIRDLEEFRRELEDGKPCPLCGATAHPYAEGNVPQEGEAEASLETARQDLRKAVDDFGELRIRDAQYEQELLRNREEEAGLRERLESLEVSLSEGLAALQWTLPPDADPLTAIGRQRQKTEEQFRKTRITVDRAEKIENDLHNARESLEQLRAEQEEAARLQQEAGFKRESAGREWGRLTQEIRLQEEELKNIRSDLIVRISPYGYRNLPDEHPEEIPEQLEARLQKWQDHQRLRVELEKELSSRERDLHYARENLGRINLELKEKKDFLKKLCAERDALQQQRTGLFGEKNPDEEEAARNASVLAAQKQVEAKREEREVVQRRFAAMTERMEELGKTIHMRADVLRKAEIAFERQLIANDFRNEGAYLSACLSEEERKTLQEREQGLMMERAELDARRTDKKFAMEELRRLQLTTRAAEDIREDLTQMSERQKKLHQSIGALHLRLDDAADSGRLRRERQAVLERQKQEYLRWERLHDLIGSADGQKYRNFAQRMTFEIVIRHANRQLQKMTDRYLLIHDEAQPLELKVVDSYQAGEIRSTRNLSGGESFIVSLALALGLSQMSSHRVRVDSLFLDEGFGTLDEEALDTALSTLAGLKQEGRLIGVISHIEAIRERIGTQIEVIPQGNGRSIIQAPGCERGA